MQVSPVNFKTLACVLDVEGFDGLAALKRCGFSSLDELDDQGPWLPVARFDALIAAVLDLTGDPSFGLVAGKSKGLMRYVALMQVTLVSPTLRQVLANITHFAPLFLDRSEMNLVEHGDEVYIEIEAVVGGGRTGRFRTEMVALSAVQLIVFARGGPDDLIAVELPFECPQGQQARYESVFGPKLRFGARRCAVVFEPRLLDVPLQTHDPVAYMAARANAEAALAARRAGLDVAERVRRALLQALPHQPSVQETAEALRMTERSLRRQLSAMGLTHAELTQQSQQVIAKHLLANREVPIKQVADRLGFASVTSFHRAFRRWTDMTPLAWRERGDAQASFTPGENPVASGQ